MEANVFTFTSRLQGSQTGWYFGTTSEIIKSKVCAGRALYYLSFPLGVYKMNLTALRLVLFLPDIRNEQADNR